MYDFYIFGSLAAVLSPKFYPPGNNTFAYFAYLATFAVGFVVRPFGVIVFGRIGDLVGRKYAFLVTLSVMGFSTALIGVLPTYATAGWFSPITLIAIRVWSCSLPKCVTRRKPPAARDARHQDLGRSGRLACAN
jgi:MFS family permease